MLPINDRTNTADPLYNYMQNVSKKLDCPFTNDIIEIPDEKGKGFVKSFFVEEGFCIGYYHFTFNEDLHFKWSADEDLKDEQVFKLIFRLKTSDHVLPSDDGSCTRNFATQNSTVLYSTDFNRTAFTTRPMVQCHQHALYPPVAEGEFYAGIRQYPCYREPARPKK